MRGGTKRASGRERGPTPVLGLLALLAASSTACGKTTSSPDPDAEADSKAMADSGSFEAAPHDAGPDAAGDASDDSSPIEAATGPCAVTTCYGSIELPTDGAVVNVGFEGGGAGYCPTICGGPGVKCGSAGACNCQCLPVESDPPSPMCTGNCVCGDSGTFINSAGGKESCACIPVGEGPCYHVATPCCGSSVCRFASDGGTVCVIGM
jgi:hypothetical protein